MPNAERLKYRRLNTHSPLIENDGTTEDHHVTGIVCPIDDNFVELVCIYVHTFELSPKNRLTFYVQINPELCILLFYKPHMFKRPVYFVCFAD